jgi:hypothetical protein
MSPAHPGRVSLAVCAGSVGVIEVVIAVAFLLVLMATIPAPERWD